MDTIGNICMNENACISSEVVTKVFSMLFSLICEQKTDDLPVLYGVDVYSSSCTVWAVDMLCEITVSVDIDFPPLSSDEVTMLKVLESVTTDIDDVNNSVNDGVAI